MSLGRNLLAGLCGAVALNILHESLKKSHSKMPRIDKLGEEALQKGILMAGGNEIKDERSLYLSTLGADLISNALYYSAIGSGKHVWEKAVALGLAAGTGAVSLPKYMGLNQDHVARTTETKSLTITYYLFGALVTAAVVSAMRKHENV